MPWEMDYALLSFTQLKKSHYFLDKNDNFYIDIVLNLSPYIINWNKSSISKNYFIEKIKNISLLLSDYKYNIKIYDENKKYGGLNALYEAVHNDMDFYIPLNPDMHLNEHLLSHLVMASKQVKNKYFVISPQIPKLWDYTWDVLSNERYKNVSYTDWKSIDIYDVDHQYKIIETEIELVPINEFKFAGWWDVYNKKMYEEFFVSEDWHGYGPCDYIAMLLSTAVKKQGIDVQQYILKNQLTCEYNTGNMKNGYYNYYKKQLHINNIPNQREEFESNMPVYINNLYKKIQSNNIKL